MKRVKSGFWLGALALIVFGGLVWHFATHYAYKGIWVDLGPIPEARNNPYHAAQKFLEQKGYNVKSSGLLAEVVDRLDPSDTLFLFYDHELEYDALNNEVNAWVKKGGHLVVTVHYLWDEDSKASGDVYLDDLGVRQYLWPRETDTPADSENDTGNSADTADDVEGADLNNADDVLPADQQTEEGTTTRVERPQTDDSDLPDDSDIGIDIGIDSDSDSEDESLETPAENQDAADQEDNPATEAHSADEKIVPLKNLNIPLDEKDDATQCKLVNEEAVSLLPLSQGSHPLRIAFESEYHIEDVSGTAHAPFTAPPAHMLEYTLGAGRITVLTDYFIFSDNNIGDFDHAFFLWWLADNSPRVWLIYDKDSDTLVSLIWESAPYLCLSILIALAGWLLYRGRRFGPILNIEHATRRQLQEHIDASTAFVWRAQEQALLIEEARQPVLNKCPIVDNKITRTPRLLRALEQLDISEERLLWALTTPAVGDEAEFVELIRLLQQLRMTL